MTEQPSVGLVHPGLMGVTIGRAISTAEVMWASDGRSAATSERAAGARFTDAGSLPNLVARCSTIISICPPAEAVPLAQSIADAGFTGTYVDANAVSPATARSIAGLFDHAVDGGIIGPPVASAGTTRLYLSGTAATEVGALFDGSDLDVRIVDGEPGAASAVKMAFAAWSKGTAALLLAINALASSEGVADDLRAEWAISMPDLIGRSEQMPAGVGPKAWRFEGEMHEIANSFAAVGLPDGFHRAAADVYGRLADLKSAANPTLDDVMRLLDQR